MFVNDLDNDVESLLNGIWWRMAARLFTVTRKRKKKIFTLETRLRSPVGNSRNDKQGSQAGGIIWEFVA